MSCEFKAANGKYLVNPLETCLRALTQQEPIINYRMNENTDKF
jgi:hypothetical protein